MHPAMIELLATEHRSELLRQAEVHRRARRSGRGGTRLAFGSAVSRAEKAVVALRRHAAVPPRTQTCCA